MTETLHPSPEITADAAAPGEPADRLRPVASPVLQLLQPARGPEYRCPGESQSISQAVHLSRLASYYAKCRSCPQASDHRALPAGGLDSAAPREADARAELFQRDGLESRYLSNIGRPQAETFATAVAAAVWEHMPRRCRSEEEPHTTVSPTPELVVGRDNGAAARDLVCGVVRGLRRMGCSVIDVGAVSRPLLDFAIYHLRTDGGVYVAGNGSSAGAVGLQMVDRNGVPWSTPGRLDRLREPAAAAISRSTRHGGNLETYDAVNPAQTEYQRHLHGVQPLRLGASIDCPLQREQAVAWSAEGPLQLVPLALDFDALTSDAHGAAARRELRARCQTEELAWTVHLARDGRQVTLLDERGRRIDPAVWLIRLAEQAAASGSGGVVVGAEVSPLTRGRLKALGWQVHAAGAEHEAIVRTLLDTRSTLAADGCGRVWFADHYPVCDGLVTLARLARLAGRSAQPISHWAA